MKRLGLLLLLASALHAQTLTSPAATVTVAPVSNASLLSGCNYLNAFGFTGGCAAPAGWTALTQNDFECSGSHAFPAQPSCGTLPSNQTTSANTPPNGFFQNVQNHTPGGSYAYGGLHEGDGSTVNWLYNLSGGNVGSFTSIYISFWEWTDANQMLGNSDYGVAQINLAGNLGCSIGFNNQYYGQASDPTGNNFASMLSGGYMQASGTGDPALAGSLFCQGTAFDGSNGAAGIPWAVRAGVWTQYEVLFTPSTTFTPPTVFPWPDCSGLSPSSPSCGNGTEKLWINGQLVGSFTNENLNGTDSFTDALVWVGSFMTSFEPRANGMLRCVYTWTTNGTDPNCPGAQPGVGGPQPFHRYFDDIIVMKQ